MKEKLVVVLIALLIPMHYLGRALFYIDLVLLILIFMIIVFEKKINVISLVDKFNIGVCFFYSIALIINYFNPSEDFSKNIRLLYSLPIVLIMLNYTFVYSKYSNKNFIFFQKILFYSVSIISSIVFFNYILDIDILYSIKEGRYIDNYFHWKYHSRQNIFAVLIAFFVYYFLMNKSIINFSALVLIYSGTFASHGRTAIITIIVGTITYFIVDSFKKDKLNLKIISILTTIILLVIVIVLIISGDRIYNLNSFTSGRFDGWLLNLDLILKDNTLLGYGTGGALQLYNEGLLGFKHPHNMYIETLFSLGLLGFFILFSITIMYFNSLLKSKKIFSKSIAIATFVAIFVNAQSIGGIWGYSHIMITLLILYISSRDIKTMQSVDKH